MEFTKGDIVCLRVTGELVTVLNPNGTDRTGREGVEVRRAVNGRDGIEHSLEVFDPCEFETSEQHLRHEAEEMILKYQIQEEMQTKIEGLKKKEGVDKDRLVN
jgi:hypothetical protein